MAEIHGVPVHIVIGIRDDGPVRTNVLAYETMYHLGSYGLEWHNISLEQVLDRTHESCRILVGHTNLTPQQVSWMIHVIIKLGKA